MQIELFGMTIIYEIRDVITVIGWIVLGAIQLRILNQQSKLQKNIEAYKLLVPRKLERLDELLDWVSKGSIHLAELVKLIMYSVTLTGKEREKAINIASSYVDNEFMSWKTKRLAFSNVISEIVENSESNPNLSMLVEKYVAKTAKYTNTDIKFVIDEVTKVYDNNGSGKEMKERLSEILGDPFDLGVINGEILRELRKAEGQVTS